MASSKKRGPKGSFKKRNIGIHNKQELLLFFEQDNISSADSINTSLIDKASIGEFYDDMGDNYENLKSETNEPIAFRNLPLEIKENMIEDMKKLELIMKERNKMKEIKEDNLPLLVSEIHKHDSIRVPHDNEIRMEQDLYSSLDSGDDDDTTTMDMLDNRRKLYLMKTIPKYNAFENFIIPKTFSSDYEIKIGNFIDNLYSKERIECMSIEFNPKNKQIFIAMNIDDRDIFFVSIKFILKTDRKDVNLLKSPFFSLFFSHDNFIDWSLQKTTTDSLYMTLENNPNLLKKEEKKLILNTIVTFQKYYYFTCGCEK